MQVHNVEQKTEAWYTLRNKYPLTASEAQSIGNQGKGLETLCWEKVAERHSSAPRDNFGNAHTDRGNELEAQARTLYALETGRKVVEVGFITDDSISPMGGASPDGLVDDDGLIEIKCFEDVKHLKSMVEPVVESKYFWQVQQQMLFTGRKWADLVMYNPNFKRNLIIVRIEADAKMQDDIRVGLKLGEKIIKDIEAKIN